MERKFQVYEDNKFGSYLRTVCEHSNGKRNTIYNESEAKAYCNHLKQLGIKYLVYEQIDVTKEF